MSQPLSNKEQTTLSVGLLRIPEVAALDYEKANLLMDKLCECIAYARLSIPWGTGKPGRRPDVEGHVLMADVQKALLDVGIDPTAWNDGIVGGQLPAKESTLFGVYRIAASIAGHYAPVNLKPLVKNSGSIQYGEKESCKWKVIIPTN